MTRTRTLGTAVTMGVTGALLALAPAAAQAAITTLPGRPVTLQPGEQVCIGARAVSDAKATGTAAAPGVIYTLERSGTEIYRTDSRRTGANSTKVFVGAGNYRWCAKNPAGLGQPVGNVSITLFTDEDA
ncbi:hypothetical protein AB0368_04100 [Actinoplanes sp. NPDC051475]|uniref:hypothetical protein n=1 Tax=Actinoplanes sp. NPDC051475 TaxID=3157225 RepID=UPI003450DA3B